MSKIHAAAESTTPPGTPPHPSAATAPLTTSKRAAHAADTTTSPSKRRYVPDQHDVGVVKRIKQNEVELRDRNTVLRGTKPNVRLYFITRTHLILQTASQNFSALHTTYAEKLKKLKESKSGAVSVPAPSAGPPMQVRKASMYSPNLIPRNF